VTRHRDLVVSGDTVSGVTYGATPVVSTFARSRGRSARHELVHVEQNRFMQETWGRPLEGWLRQRTPGLRRIPTWVELGVAAPAVAAVETAAYGSNGPLARAKEAEAKGLATH
jgi:hypothetical protein